MTNNFTGPLCGLTKEDLIATRLFDANGYCQSAANPQKQQQNQQSPSWMPTFGINAQALPYPFTNLSSKLVTFFLIVSSLFMIFSLIGYSNDKDVVKSMAWGKVDSNGGTTYYVGLAGLYFDSYSTGNDDNDDYYSGSVFTKYEDCYNDYNTCGSCYTNGNLAFSLTFISLLITLGNIAVMIYRQYWSDSFKWKLVGMCSSLVSMSFMIASVTSFLSTCVLSISTFNTDSSTDITIDNSYMYTGSSLVVASVLILFVCSIAQMIFPVIVYEGDLAAATMWTLSMSQFSDIFNQDGPLKLFSYYSVFVCIGIFFDICVICCLLAAAIAYGTNDTLSDNTLTNVAWGTASINYDDNFFSYDVKYGLYGYKYTNYFFYPPETGFIAYSSSSCTGISCNNCENYGKYAFAAVMISIWIIFTCMLVSALRIAKSNVVNSSWGLKWIKIVLEFIALLLLLIATVLFNNNCINADSTSILIQPYGYYYSTDSDANNSNGMKLAISALVFMFINLISRTLHFVISLIISKLPSPILTGNANERFAVASAPVLAISNPATANITTNPIVHHDDVKA